METDQAYSTDAMNNFKEQTFTGPLKESWKYKISKMKNDLNAFSQNYKL